MLNVIRDLKARGKAVLYISHRLNEVAAISDRVTVLRDGKHITTRNTAELKPVEMARLMVGRDVSHLYPDRRPKPESAPILEVSGFDVPGFASNASFAVRAGEILGFAGLIGAGRTEVARAIFGADPKSSGTIALGGHEIEVGSPIDAINHGIAYLSEDRKSQGLALNMSL